MKLAFFNKKTDKHGVPHMSHWAKLALSFCFLGLPLSAGVMLGVELAGGRFGLLVDESMGDLKREIEQQKEDLEQTKSIADQKVQSLTVKLASMQAKLIRLDALGERLSGMADLSGDEFDFSQAPALGGPIQYGESGSEPLYIESLYDKLLHNMSQSEQRLLLLESLYQENYYRKQNTIAGRPVEKGWMSSPYGYRVDPFKGTKAWHNGVDFAAKEGSKVLAVASGVVTKSQKKPGYGMLVEIDHGEGYVTHYAHNKENHVRVGDLVSKGQVIASIGSTGRSTGPHVHFEVFKHGRSVDPASYIHRNNP